MQQVNYLSTLFLVPIAAIGVAAAIHATAYLHGEARAHLPRFWFFFLGTLLAMTLVVFSEGKLDFILFWEAMGLLSSGLVSFESKDKAARKATWIYLLACHAGACALMLAGVILDRPGAFLAAFVLAIVGFGLKIGFPPFHVWLPEAHPAAPAPASAVMSGAMIPLGFYGLLTFFWPTITVVPFAATASTLLLVFGALAALGGIAFALPQTNLKKLLAFSSVENMGVIAIGLGLATASRHASPETAAISSFAFAGALIHVLNHAFLKGALFLGAGSVLRQTGTLDQDRLGGLMKRMPKTGTLFTLNALGLAGLPPLNGFLGELLIYTAAFLSVKSGVPSLIAAGLATLAILALTGGLATAAYLKAIGATFLGEPRSREAAEAVETPRRMYLAQLLLFTCSLAMIPLSVFLGGRLTDGAATPILSVAAAAGVITAILAALLVGVRRFLTPRGAVKPALPTWDCGYHAPTARMAYTATAFTQPLADLLRPILKPRRHLIAFKGHPSAPTDAALATETDDRALAGFWRPLFTKIARGFQLAHLFQNGSLHFYVLVLLLAVIALLIAAFVL